MNVHAQISIPWPVRDAIALQDEALSTLMPENGSHVYLDFPSDAFSKLMKFSFMEKYVVSCRFTVNVSELDQVDWYAIESNSSCGTNDKDEKWRSSTWDALPFVTGTKNVRQFSEYRISKIRHVGKKVVSPGGTFYFVPKEVIEIFERNNFTGIKWGDIYNLKGEERFEDFRLLIPVSLVGPSEKNAAMEYKTGTEADGEYSTYDYNIPRSGVRSFHPDSLKDAKDFNLTTEPMSGYNVGSIIVSRRVKELIEKEKIKGVFFEPVLTTDTPLYKKFLKQWSAFYDEIKSANPNNRIN